MIMIMIMIMIMTMTMTMTMTMIIIIIIVFSAFILSYDVLKSMNECKVVAQIAAGSVFYHRSSQLPWTAWRFLGRIVRRCSEVKYSDTLNCILLTVNLSLSMQDVWCTGSFNFLDQSFAETKD